MTTKITNKEVLMAVLEMEEVKSNPLYVEKLTAMVTAIDKKSANRKPTAKQTENEDKKTVILSVMSETEGKTITQIMKACAEIGTEFTSNQQCTALVRQLINDNKVVRVEDKRTTLFYLVEEV